MDKEEKKEVECALGADPVDYCYEGCCDRYKEKVEDGTVEG